MLLVLGRRRRQQHGWEHKHRVGGGLQEKITPWRGIKCNTNMGGKLCGHLVYLGSHEKSDRIRTGGPVTGVLQGEAGYTVMLTIFSWESQGPQL